jgi:hypothetical protein
MQGDKIVAGFGANKRTSDYSQKSIKEEKLFQRRWWEDNIKANLKTNGEWGCEQQSNAWVQES